MKLQRRINKLKQKSKMKLINFPAENYSFDDKKKSFVFEGEGVLGTFELLWTAFKGARPEPKFTNKEHKTTKKLKDALRKISRYKDEDEDSRILSEGPQRLLLEDAQLDILKRILESNDFLPIISDEITLLNDIIDSATEFTPEVLDDRPSIKLEE